MASDRSPARFEEVMGFDWKVLPPDTLTDPSLAEKMTQVPGSVYLRMYGVERTFSTPFLPRMNVLAEGAAFPVGEEWLLELLDRDARSFLLAVWAPYEAKSGDESWQYAVQMTLDDWFENTEACRVREVDGQDLAALLWQDRTERKDQR